MVCSLETRKKLPKQGRLILTSISSSIVYVIGWTRRARKGSVPCVGKVRIAKPSACHPLQENTAFAEHACVVEFKAKQTASNVVVDAQEPGAMDTSQ